VQHHVMMIVGRMDLLSQMTSGVSCRDDQLLLLLCYSLDYPADVIENDVARRSLEFLCTPTNTPFQSCY
jgi:hypothetical protein